MGRLLAEAQAIAQNEYNASEGAQLLLETNKTLADNLKNDAGLQKKYWVAGYEMGVQFSKGMASAINSSSLTQTQNDKVISGYYGAYASNVMTNRRSYAYGISYVPYDNYPAILHEGERVLTASENRNYGKSVPVVITGNNFYIREEADIDKIAREIVTQINRAYQLVD